MKIISAICSPLLLFIFYPIITVKLFHRNNNDSDDTEFPALTLTESYWRCVLRRACVCVCVRACESVCLRL